MRIKTSIFALAAMVGSLGAAEAACTVASVAGNWDLEADRVACKAVEINTMGKGNGRCTDTAGTPATLGMSIGVDASCKITAIVDVDGRRFSLTGRVEQAAGTLKPGMLVGRLSDASGSWQIVGFRN